MGWLPSIFGGEKSSSDPLGKLDPKLREFLEKESPVKYTPNQATPPPSTPQAQPKNEQLIAQPISDQPAVPSASLYQDGRYAHLWKNYRPLSQVESESATDHDKLMNVLDGFKERKAAIGRAALENCALQQEEWVNCMKNGSWEDQLQMCRHQVRRFERCYTMQSVRCRIAVPYTCCFSYHIKLMSSWQRFLRALGYGSVTGRPAQVDEDIQMHADSLYDRMLRHEETVEQAKKDGTPIPTFDPALPKASVPRATPTSELEKTWKEKLDKLPEDERVFEEAALRADLQAKSDVATNVKQLWAAQKEERETRKSEGQATLGDTFSALFGKGSGGPGSK